MLSHRRSHFALPVAGFVTDPFHRYLIGDNEHFFWNFTWATLSGALLKFGATFADRGTVVSVLVGRLTGSAVAVGVAESIVRYDWLLPQLFAVMYGQR